MQFYWHVHHDQLLEPLTGPVEDRVKYIRTSKPEHEVTTRLRLLTPALGVLPRTVEKAGETWFKAAEEDRANMPGAWKRLLNAGMVYLRVVRNNASINELHERECPNCPWDGETIFPEGDN